MGPKAAALGERKSLEDSVVGGRNFEACGEWKEHSDTLYNQQGNTVEPME